jgi:hypothetical protein
MECRLKIEIENGKIPNINAEMLFYYFEENKCTYKNGLGSADPAICSTVL